LKGRICSTSQTNSRSTFNVQPPSAPQSDSELPHQFGHVPAPTKTTTSDVYAENEEEENEEGEKEEEQRPVVHKRAWLVNVIGKPNLFKFFS